MPVSALTSLLTWSRGNIKLWFTFIYEFIKYSKQTNERTNKTTCTCHGHEYNKTLGLPLGTAYVLGSTVLIQYHKEK